MKVRRVQIDNEIFGYLKASIERSNIEISDLIAWLDEGSAAIWDIGGTGYAVSVANKDNEIEIILAGGKDAVQCVIPWEKAMREDPHHKGMKLRMEGRRGWKRLLPHWNCVSDDGCEVVLETRV